MTDQRVEAKQLEARSQQTELTYIMGYKSCPPKLCWFTQMCFLFS